MARHRPSGSYGHKIALMPWGDYRIMWTVDRYYEGSRLRFPRGCTRDTDEAGARRFAKRWGLEMPALGIEARQGQDAEGGLTEGESPARRATPLII